MCQRPAIAWVEEWMSWRAFNVLPRLAEQFDITYVTTGDDVPPARFRRVFRFPRRTHMMIAGFSLSRCVDRLYEAGDIDLALVYASIGFAIRKAPYVTLEGGSVYREVQLFCARAPWYRRPRFLVGFMHYAVPEILCVRSALRVIAISHSLKADLVALHRVPDERVAIAYNGIGPEYLRIYGTSRPVGRPRTLYVGRLHFRKGILSVLEEFAKRPNIDTEFVVVGDGPDRAAIEAIARTDPRVQYVGPADRQRIVELLATSEIFMFPTFYEGFGSALVEAMAAGLTCLAYEMPVTVEILRDAGMMVPLGDARGMVDRLAEVIETPERRARFGRAAHGLARQYSWTRCASKIADVLNGQLARGEAKAHTPSRCGEEH